MAQRAMEQTGEIRSNEREDMESLLGTKMWSGRRVAEDLERETGQGGSPRRVFARTVGNTRASGYAKRHKRHVAWLSVALSRVALSRAARLSRVSGASAGEGAQGRPWRPKHARHVIEPRSLRG